MTQIDMPSSRYVPFQNRQILLLLVIGAILWFLAAQLLHWLGPMGVYDGSTRFVMYALTVPGTVPFLIIAFKLAKVEKSERMLACAVMLWSATLIDGAVLAWLPWIYGDTPELVAGAGGTVLWGVGVVLTIGFLMNRSKEVSGEK